LPRFFGQGERNAILLIEVIVWLPGQSFRLALSTNQLGLLAVPTPQYQFQCLFSFIMLCLVYFFEKHLLLSAKFALLESLKAF
jgi:hypothetical protein